MVKIGKTYRFVFDSTTPNEELEEFNNQIVTVISYHEDNGLYEVRMVCGSEYDVFEHELQPLNLYEEAGRKAFDGLQYEDILRQAGLLPGGCTLQDTIDYFVTHGEELEALGLI